METLILIIGGLIGAGNAYKKSFTSCWLFLINLVFALYSSIFLAPLIIPLLNIPGLAAEYKYAISLGGASIVAYVVLQKISVEIIPSGENDTDPFPFSRIMSAAAGFLSGLLIAAILTYCFMQTPFFNGIPGKKDFRTASGCTLMGVVHTVNFFSFQSLTKKAENDLRNFNLQP